MIRACMQYSNYTAVILSFFLDMNTAYVRWNVILYVTSLMLILLEFNKETTFEVLFLQNSQRKREKESLFWCHLPIWPLGARVDLPKVRSSARQG